MNTNLQAIIPYCLFDEEHIRECIDALLPVCDKVRISFSKKLWGGQSQNLDTIDQLKEEYKDVVFKEYTFEDLSNVWQIENRSRSCLIEDAISDNATHLLMMDSDEILDTKRFKSWWAEADKTFPCFQFRCFWYFRDKKYRATTTEQAGTLARVDLHGSGPTDHSARNYYKRNGCNLVDYQGIPIVHHYSWAKSKDHLMMKVLNWGHKGEKNWVSLVEQEFNRPFNGSDFIHGYAYEILEREFQNDL